MGIAACKGPSVEERTMANLVNLPESAWDPEGNIGEYLDELKTEDDFSFLFQKGNADEPDIFKSVSNHFGYYDEVAPKDVDFMQGELAFRPIENKPGRITIQFVTGPEDNLRYWNMVGALKDFIVTGSQSTVFGVHYCCIKLLNDKAETDYTFCFTDRYNDDAVRLFTFLKDICRNDHHEAAALLTQKIILDKYLVAKPLTEHSIAAGINDDVPKLDEMIAPEKESTSNGASTSKMSQSVAGETGEDSYDVIAMTPFDDLKDIGSLPNLPQENPVIFLDAGELVERVRPSMVKRRAVCYPSTSSENSSDRPYNMRRLAETSSAKAQPIVMASIVMTALLYICITVYRNKQQQQPILPLYN